MNQGDIDEVDADPDAVLSSSDSVGGERDDDERLARDDLVLERDGLESLFGDLSDVALDRSGAADATISEEEPGGQTVPAARQESRGVDDAAIDALFERVEGSVEPVAEDAEPPAITADDAVDTDVRELIDSCDPRVGPTPELDSDPADCPVVWVASGETGTGTGD